MLLFQPDQSQNISENQYEVLLYSEAFISHQASPVFYTHIAMDYATPGYQTQLQTCNRAHVCSCHADVCRASLADGYICSMGFGSFSSYDPATWVQCSVQVLTQHLSDIAAVPQGHWNRGALQALAPLAGVPAFAEEMPKVKPHIAERMAEMPRWGKGYQQ